MSSRRLHFARQNLDVLVWRHVRTSERPHHEELPGFAGHHDPGPLPLLGACSTDGSRTKPAEAREAAVPRSSALEVRTARAAFPIRVAQPADARAAAGATATGGATSAGGTMGGRWVGSGGSTATGGLDQRWRTHERRWRDWWHDSHGRSGRQHRYWRSGCRQHCHWRSGWR